MSKGPWCSEILGGRGVACECMQGPGKRPAWHDSYTIHGIPLEEPLVLAITAYDVYDNGNQPIGAHNTPWHLFAA